MTVGWGKANWPKSVWQIVMLSLYLFLSNFNTHNLLSETEDTRGSSESRLIPFRKEASLMGQPLPLRHWPGKPSFCLKPIQSERGGVTSGRKVTSPLVKCGKALSPTRPTPWLIQLISTTVYENTCVECL